MQNTLWRNEERKNCSWVRIQLRFASVVNEDLEPCQAEDLMTRKRAGSHKLLEQLADLRVTGNLSDGLLMCFRHEWRRIIGGELFVFFVKIRIPVGLVESFL